MNLLIMGAPGTGKGTLSALIKDEYKIPHISTGDMLREAIAAKTPVGLEAEKRLAKGEFVSDEIIHGIIVDRFKVGDLNKGFLFDGYPRTLPQAIDLENILKEHGMKIDYVINLNLDDEVLKDRITGRRICKKCNKIYHLTNLPPRVPNVCDDCGGELYQRSDDTLEALKERMSVYNSLTKPVIDYFEKQGIVLNFDCNKNAKDVFNDIKVALR